MTSDDKANESVYKPLLEVKDFSITFRHFQKGLREVELEAIRRLTITIDPGEIVAVVGASGSGKSLLANAILGVLPENATTAGTLNYLGEPLTKKKQVELRGQEISLIPQSVNALDPLMKTGKQVQAVIKTADKEKIQQRIFTQVGLPEETEDLYPFELSGGMARRVLAATAMVSGARLVIADEPTPGLDPEALQEIVTHLKQLALDGKGIMFITHDIAVATEVAHKIAVFYAGETVEIADAKDFSGKGEKLQHAYSKALWNALPQNEFTRPFSSTYGLSDTIQTGEQATGNRPRKDTSTSSILEVKDIHFRYPNRPWLVKGMHLSVNPGEVVGLFGYSGSGKSTIAQIISGYLEPLAGRIRIGNEPIPTEGMHPVQMVWQHPEKAINPRWLLKKTLQEAGPIDTHLMKALGIKEEWLERLPRELSGGELQRFSLARAVANEQVQYVIADEMTTMLDAITQAHIWHTMTTVIKERNVGVIAISHDQALLHKVCDRIVNFSDVRYANDSFDI